MFLDRMAVTSMPQALCYTKSQSIMPVLEKRDPRPLFLLTITLLALVT